MSIIAASCYIFFVDAMPYNFYICSNERGLPKNGNEPNEYEIHTHQAIFDVMRRKNDN